VRSGIRSDAGFGSVFWFTISFGARRNDRRLTGASGPIEEKGSFAYWWFDDNAIESVEF